MAIQLTLIDPDNDLISAGPSQINSNFQAIETHINALEGLIQTDASSIKLSNNATIPANSIESATIVLTASTGGAIIVNPDGGGAVATIDTDGQITARNIVVDGVDSEGSSFGDVTINGDAAFGGEVAIDGLLKLNDSNSRVARKYRTLAVTDINIGNSATNPVDVTYDDIIYLDYNNGGVALGGNADVKLDTSNLEEGQVIKIICLRTNTAGIQRLNNGSVGSEIFAYIDPNNNGFTTVSSSTRPAFEPQASPDNQSWVEVQWTNIGGGNYRLVVLDSENVTGIN